MARKRTRKAAAAALAGLPRRQVRYWCFRLRSARQGGAAAKGAPAGLKAHFEDNTWFGALGGWEGFAVRWDVDAVDPLTVVPREKSVWQQWQAEVAATAGDLPEAADAPGEL